MITSSNTEKPFTARFMDTGSKVHLELTNECNQTLKCVEVLAVFLKDEETPGGGPSRANIKFETIKSLLPNEKFVLSHRTWIDGKPAEANQDQLERLKAVAGKVKPYVLDISWENEEGKHAFNGYL